MRVGAAILGSGNIGTDLMAKIIRRSRNLELRAFVGIDPKSDGLKRACQSDVPVSHEGIDGLVKMPSYEDIAIVFDATSAAAHARHDRILQEHGKRVIDLTPAAIGPYVVPTVNLESHLSERNLSMVTCGGQATIPIVAAVSRVARVHYAEIVASIASRSAGPGTRANIDEFTQTTARAIERVGNAERGKAIIVLNPAEPPLVMRDTVYCLCPEGADTAQIEASIQQMVRSVNEYVPGYRLKQAVRFEEAVIAPGALGAVRTGVKVTVFLEVEGAADYLPRYAGNLDIMTSAALRTAESLADRHPSKGNS